MGQKVRRKDLGQQSYFFVREKEWEGIGYFPKNKNNRPIIVVKGNAVIWFPCRNALIESINISKTTLYKSIKHNHGRIPSLDVIARHANTTNDLQILKNAGYEVLIHD